MNYLDNGNQLRNLQGVYILVLELKNHLKINSNRFTWMIKPGFYLYFGSARGKTATNLRNRLLRHLKRKKKIFWHIDHFTSHSDAKTISIYYNTCSEITECSALQEIKDEFQESITISNFGSSDCKSNCGGHLLFFPSKQVNLTDFEKYFLKKRWKKSKLDSDFKENR